MEEAIPAASAQARLRLRRILADFEAYPDPISYVRTIPAATRVSVQPSPGLPGYLIWCILHVGLGLEDLGTFEKTLWEIPFRFKGVRCGIARQKFGVRVYVDTRDATAKDAERLAEDGLAALSRAVRLVEEEILKPFANQQIEAGHVTVTNNQARLRSAYEYFRARARQAQEERPEWRSETMSSGGVHHWSTRREIGTRVFDDFIASVNAYFSVLEHTLVLLLPFSDFDSSRETLSRFITEGWQDKFKRICNIGTEREAKLFYDRLLEVAEEYRNPYDHGAFDKTRGQIYFHVPGLGALPARLRKATSQPHVRFLFGAGEVEPVWQLFDEVDEWMRTGARRYGLMFVEAGFDVPLDSDSIRLMEAATTSEESFASYLEYRQYLEDRARNMDW